ncbi:hypothetical protein HPB51_023452 [Rhipicephalus microplus]|uniref:N-acetylgalactosaminide beta-1,3-galactosyltransferase n=1 Tax=Rhipicephalus microplus TaxID=6941 RepID=A0A9J6F6D5_RHIMP|nr:hypothetical protein HPB51_023452 [Rhipicephalus microplus]
MLKAVSGIGVFQMSHVWLVKFRTRQANDTAVGKSGLRVKSGYCGIIDPCKQEITLKFHWVSFRIPGEAVRKTLSEFGEMKDKTTEEQNAAEQHEWGEHRVCDLLEDSATPTKRQRTDATLPSERASDCKQQHRERPSPKAGRQKGNTSPKSRLASWSPAHGERNRKYFLLDKDPTRALYFGYPFRMHIPNGYTSGGSGYVLSRGALLRLVEQGMMQGKCRSDGAGSEDAELGRCLMKVGVSPGDTRDALGRDRFFPLRLEHYFWQDTLPLHWWIWRYAKYPVRPGWNCCSDTAVAFHYTKPDMMYVYEFFVYHVRVLGGLDERVHPRHPPIPELTL